MSAARGRSETPGVGERVRVEFPDLGAAAIAGTVIEETGGYVRIDIDDADIELGLPGDDARLSIGGSDTE